MVHSVHFEVYDTKITKTFGFLLVKTFIFHGKFVYSYPEAFPMKFLQETNPFEMNIFGENCLNRTHVNNNNKTTHEKRTRNCITKWNNYIL